MTLLLCSISLAGAQQFVARDVTGRVEFQTGGGTWQTLARGMDIPISALISTGFQSRAVLESDTSTLTVQPLTRLTIDEIQNLNQTESQTRISLRSGRISAEVKKNEENPSRFEVKSPVATAAVRGTSFTFNGFQLSVQSGIVAFGRPGGRVVTVPVGRKSEMKEGGVPAEVDEAVYEQISAYIYSLSSEVTTSDIVDVLELLDLVEEIIPDDQLYVYVK